MPAHPSANLRTLAFVGHAGVGKTTLVEALLAANGTLASPGTMMVTVKISDGHNRIGSGRGRGETAGNHHAGRDWRSLAASLAK